MLGESVDHEFSGRLRRYHRPGPRGFSLLESGFPRMLPNVRFVRSAA
jgi:hypothetical protein